MSGDKLPRKTNSRIEIIKVLFDQRCHQLFNVVQAYSLGNPKTSSLMTVRFQLFNYWSQNIAGIYIAHFLPKSEQ